MLKIRALRVLEPAARISRSPRPLRLASPSRPAGPTRYTPHSRLGLPLAPALEGRFTVVIASHGASFDKHLRGQTASLLDGPSGAFPEVTFRSE